MNDPAKPSDLPVRAAVGVLLIAVAAGALWLGGIIFWLLVAVAGTLMLHEWGTLHGSHPKAIRTAQLALFVPFSLISPWAAGPGFFALGTIGAAALFSWAVTRDRSLVIGSLYVGLPVIGLVALREFGAIYALWAMALVWACDIGAYFTGRAFGGPKLAPLISPNKTWAGFVGGVVAALMFGIAMLQWAGLPFMLAAVTPLLAVAAQLGDLYESALKRRAGVKDSGSLLPGHGGLLDRLDGLVPVAPLAALAVLLLVGQGG